MYSTNFKKATPKATKNNIIAIVWNIAFAFPIRATTYLAFLKPTLKMHFKNSYQNIIFCYFPFD